MVISLTNKEGRPQKGADTVDLPHELVTKVATPTAQAATCGLEGRESEPLGPKNSLIRRESWLALRRYWRESYFSPRILGKLQRHGHEQL